MDSPLKMSCLVFISINTLFCEGLDCARTPQELHSKDEDRRTTSNAPGFKLLRQEAGEVSRRDPKYLSWPKLERTAVEELKSLCCHGKTNSSAFRNEVSLVREKKSTSPCQKCLAHPLPGLVQVPAPSINLIGTRCASRRRAPTTRHIS